MMNEKFSWSLVQAMRLVEKLMMGIARLRARDSAKAISDLATLIILITLINLIALINLKALIILIAWIKLIALIKLIADNPQ